jgi:hypothetical protein
MSGSSAAGVLVMGVLVLLEALVGVWAQRAAPLKRSPPPPEMSPSDWLRPEKFIIQPEQSIITLHWLLLIIATVKFTTLTDIES